MTMEDFNPNQTAWDSEEDGLSLDFGGVKDSVAPEGVYLLQVASVPKMKQTKSGNQQVSLMYRIVQDRKGDESYAGKTVWDNWMLLPQSRWYMQQALEALTGQEWRDDSMKLNLKDLVGLKVWAVVKTDSYNNRESNKVDKYLTDAVPSNGSGASSISNEVPF